MGIKKKRDGSRGSVSPIPSKAIFHKRKSIKKRGERGEIPYRVI